MKRIPAIVICAACFAGCATSTVVTDTATATRLNGIIIPEVAIRGATMPDVIEFLVHNSAPICGPWPDLQQTIANGTVTYRIHWAGKKRGLEYDLTQTGPRITFSAKDISLMDTIREVVRLAGGTCGVDKDMVTITTKEVQQGVAPVQKESPEAVDPF